MNTNNIFSDEVVIELERSKNENKKLLFEKFINSKNNLFIIDFEGSARRSDHNIEHNFVNFIPLTFSIYIKNNKEEKCLHFNIFTHYNNYQKWWNDYILNNYNFEQVVVWGRAAELEIFTHLIPYTNNRNLKKIKSFFKILDLQILFGNTFFIEDDHIPFFDLKLFINKKLKFKNITNLEKVDILIKQILNPKTTFLSLRDYNFLIRKRKRKKFFFQLESYFEKMLANPLSLDKWEKNKLNNSEVFVKFYEQLKNYNNQDVISIYELIMSLEHLNKLLNANNNKVFMIIKPNED